jgi:hypothetical protein
MNKTLKLYLENFIGSYRQTEGDLAKIGQDPDFKDQPAQIRDAMVRGARLKRVLAMQRTGKTMHSDFLNNTWPVVEQLRKAEAQRILLNLKGGPRSARTSLTDEQWRELGITSREAKTVYLQGEQTLVRLENSERLAMQQLSVTMHAMRPTKDIEALVNSYREAAKGDLAGFDRAAWQADRIVLPLLLRQRAALPPLSREEAKDGKLDDPNRAGMLLESNFVAEIESAVVAQTVEPDLDSQFFIERIEDVLDGMVSMDGGQPVENLKSAAEFCGRVERRLSRDQQPGPAADTPPPSIPSAA